MSDGRRHPVGAEVMPDGRVHVRVWAPARRRVAVRLGDDSGPVELAAEDEGYFAGYLPEAGAGTLYAFLLDDDPKPYPDPASRFQPEGPDGPSLVVDPAAFAWSDQDWRGPEPRGRVVYEMHVGTFTQEGSWAAAEARLPDLADLGVTILEVMPVAEFPGRFGWSYDGVLNFAPTRLYGEPDDFRRLVDRAHSLGIAVILDVVYNHLGPDRNCLPTFSPYWFNERYENEWGEALNFDGPHCGPVRDYFLANAVHWIDEYHLDGLRLDATQQIRDASPRHMVAELAARVRQAARGRRIFIVAENEPQQIRQVMPADRGGDGLDAMWNDDFHHSARVALTGRREAYYTSHAGTPQEFVSCAKYGFLYQGQHYAWQGKKRGTPAFGTSPSCFVTYLQNHDQVANSARGLRIDRMCSPGNLRAMTALLLLGPGTPMLFQGQEFMASTPFLYFADHEGDLAGMVRDGRASFLSQFPSIAAPDMRGRLAPPEEPETFRASRLDHGEAVKARHAGMLALHRDLLRLRREDPAFDQPEPGRVDGAVLGPAAFLLRFFHPLGDRLLLVNLGADHRLEAMPEPLLAPPEGREWRLLWSSEDPRYGGSGTPEPVSDGPWTFPGQAALLLGDSA
jgi:maltooligosyltrehalose trehalohydrolase